MTAPFDGLRPPTPTPELRVRVLGAAFAAEAEAQSWVDRLWESRRFRLALAAGFVLAIGAQLLTRDRPSPQVAYSAFVEIDGFLVRADRFEANAPSPLEAAE